MGTCLLLAIQFSLFTVVDAVLGRSSLSIETTCAEREPSFLPPLSTTVFKFGRKKFLFERLLF